ncbi:MAG TPA: PAS domain-containing protein [Bacteroidia bacterium]|nr:PAS domain-containing protein [Bacteroidia bacterium]
MKELITQVESADMLTEETLLKETEKLAHIGSWQYNYQTGIGKWSDEAYHLLGYNKGEVAPTFKSFLERIHPDDYNRVLKAHGDIQKKGLITQQLEHRIINFATNKVRYLCTKLIFERDTLGEPLQAIGFIQDITSAKLAEKKLLQSQVHLLASQRIANIGSWEIDLSGAEDARECPIFWSDQTYRIYGLLPNEFPITFDIAINIVHPEDRGMLLKKFNDAKEKSKTYNVEYRIVRPDGSERIVHTRAEVMRDRISGKATKMIGTMQDITEHVEEEETLQKSEANLRTIFDNTEATYVLINSDLKIVSFNKSALVSFNTETGKSLKTGESILDFIVEDRKQRAAEMYKRVFDGEQFRLEDNYIQKDGKKLWYHMQLLPVYGKGNKVLNMLIHLRNITQQKEAEKEREKITTDLIQRNKDLEQFSYIISHNLRLPVANILGLVNNFTIHKLPAAEQKEIISAIYISTRRLDDVVMDLNKILDIKNGECESKQQVKFSDVLNDTQVGLGYLIKKENAIIESDFSEVNELLTVKSYMSSIFYNLILNSIKFRQPALTPRIIIKCIKSENKIILTFCDNGLGIDMAKNSDGLFGLYKRFHSHENGKGMGLFMVKAQVESLGGNITVRSEVNRGTCFIIEFEQ